MNAVVPSTGIALTKVLDLEKWLATLPQCELPTQHYFIGNMYCRSMCIAKGVALVGRIHKKDHFFMVVKGWLKVTAGDEVIDLVAPTIITCKTGVKRAGYAVEDTICLTVHQTDKTTVEEAEDEIAETDSASMYGVGNTLKSLEYK